MISDIHNWRNIFLFFYETLCIEDIRLLQLFKQMKQAHDGPSLIIFINAD